MLSVMQRLFRAYKRQSAESSNPAGALNRQPSAEELDRTQLKASHPRQCCGVRGRTVPNRTNQRGKRTA